MVVFGGQLQGRSVTGKAGDDAAMLFCKAGRVKCLAKLPPPQAGIGHDAGLFFDRKSMYYGRQCTDGLFHAFIRRSQLKSRIEGFEVLTEFCSKSKESIRCGRERFRHGTPR